MLTSFILAGSFAFLQGWLGNSNSNVLSATGLKCDQSPFVGIGTNLPTEQLHTTLGVRFEGLTQNDKSQQLLVQDASGKLYWRDAASIVPPAPPSNFWNIVGNAGTNAGAIFLGTTDNQPLIIKSNNSERMRITENGNIGVGIINPKTFFHIVRGNTTGAIAFPYETFVVERNSDLKLGIYNSGQPATGGASIAFGYSNYLKDGLYPGYDIQYGIDRSNRSFLRFNGLNRTTQGLVVNANENHLVIDSVGRIGIHLGPVNGQPNLPTAYLHVRDSVRFQDLPRGTGDYLVIDNLGYVKRNSSAFQSTSSVDSKGLENKIEILKDEIAMLKAQINDIKGQMKSNVITLKTSQTVYSVYPNPANNILHIDLKSNSSSSIVTKLVMSTADGKILKSLPIYSNYDFSVKGYAAGAYILTFFENENAVQSERIIIEN